jgi:hypothetical protein
MQQLLFHLWGDFIFQTHWMARKKVDFDTEGWMACLLHCFLYSFMFITIASDKAMFIIFITHFIIDKFRLAKYVIAVKNSLNIDHMGLISLKWFNSNSGFPKETPLWLSTWLLFIVDNVIHVTINYYAMLSYPK